MNHSTSLRSAQSLTAATPSTGARTAASAPYLRAALLGGLAILGTIGSAMAQGAPSVKAKQTDAQSLGLTVENPTQQRMQIQVVCPGQHACLVEVNHKASYGTQLSFSGLPAGQYAVLLRVGRERYRYDVQVQSQPQTTISVPGLAPANAPEAVASATR